MGDHMSADMITDKVFPKVNKYLDTINSEGDLGYCIKNQYVTVEWIETLIGTKEWKYIGKDKSLYEYFIDCDDIRKPNTVHGLTEEQLYQYASGDMQFDFDDLNEEQNKLLYESFVICSEKNPCYNWFETSWSGKGCHIRVYVKLKMKTKLEWGFWYIHLLNGILKYYSGDIDEIVEHIDWSCCTITRGFAIPYNEGGVKKSRYYNEDKIIEINNEDELDKIFQNISFDWNDNLYNYFVSKVVAPKKKKELQHMGIISEKEGYKYRYSVEEEWELDENHPIVSGEDHDYNWRLSLVTSLMVVFNKDIEVVREICKYIYKFIGEYKNHTYEEMIGNEFDKKIIPKANYELEPNHHILKELWNDWGIKITIRKNIL